MGREKKVTTILSTRLSGLPRALYVGLLTLARIPSRVGIVVKPQLVLFQGYRGSDAN